MDEERVETEVALTLTKNKSIVDLIVLELKYNVIVSLPLCTLLVSPISLKNSSRSGTLCRLVLSCSNIRVLRCVRVHVTE